MCQVKFYSCQKRMLKFVLRSASTPWLYAGDSVVDPNLPELAPHPLLNPVVQVLDSNKLGRPPKRIAFLLDIPARCLVVRKDGSLPGCQALTRGAIRNGNS